MRRLSSKRAAHILASLGMLAMASCQALVEPDVGKGFGEVCVADDECQAGMCVEGLCTVSCSAAADCPAPRNARATYVSSR